MTVFNKNQIVNVTPTITAGAYSANDVVGGLITLLVPSLGGGSTLRRVVVIDDDNEKAALNIYVFTAQPSAIADNAAFAPTVADLQKLIAVIPVAAADYTTVNSNAYAIVPDLGIDVALNGGYVYAYVVCTGTPAYTATTDLTFRFGFWLD